MQANPNRMNLLTSSLSVILKMNTKKTGIDNKSIPHINQAVSIISFKIEKAAVNCD